MGIVAWGISAVCCLLHRFLVSRCVQVIPHSRHRAVGKNSGKTKGIERFNCTLRQRVSRLGARYLVLLEKTR